MYYDLQFRSLQYALFTSCFFQALGAFFFLMTSYYVLDDKKTADRMIAGQELAEDDDQVPIARNMYADESESANAEAGPAEGVAVN